MTYSRDDNHPRGTGPVPAVTNAERGRAGKEWFGKITLVIVATAIPCVAAELILRALAPPADTPGLFMELSSEMEYSGKPNSRGLLAGVPVAFNRFGLRDREHSLQPIPKKVRIIVLGDSVTFGLGAEEEDAYPRKTESLLNASRKNERVSVEILNFGIPGYNTSHELAQLRELGLAFRPQLVVVGFLYNDIELTTNQRARIRHARTDGVREDAKSPSLARKLKTGVNASIVYLKKNSFFFAWLTPRLGVALRPLGFKGFGQTGEIKDQYADSSPGWRWTRSALLDIKKICDERNIQFVVMIIPSMAKFTDSSYPIKEYHDAVLNFCKASSLNCLDLLPAFWGSDGTRFWISPTDGHPNAEGHQIMAEALADFLIPLLPRKSVNTDGAASR